MTHPLLLLLLALTTSPADVPRPEHPRPDMHRAEWMNLNGTWEFQETDEERGPAQVAFNERIVVPFARESKLSGIERKGFVKNVWYRRTFDLPRDWKSKRTRIHVGASDWRTTVWINDQELGVHTGGSTAFAFDATRALKPGRNTVVIHAFDDTRSGLQALGKQSITPQSEGIFYTRTTGIWQTVWLEGVGESFVKNIHIVPDVANRRFGIQAEVDGDATGLTLRAVARAGGRVVADRRVPADWRNTRLDLAIRNPRQWSVDDPFLYDLEFTLERQGTVIDRLASYAGMRSVSIDGRAILINGKRVFQRLVLDQGFYPDGIWTAPTEEALKADIELAMAAGFNGARLHQKVFEPRFLYWADRLGYLCWGEFPNYGLNHNDPRIERPVIEEWASIVRRDRNHPSIIGWCAFNETPREAIPLQDTVVRLTWQLDPTRPVIETSGWSHGFSEPEVLDAHDYDQNPASFRARWFSRLSESGLPSRYGRGRITSIPFMISEYGGIGWNIKDGWGYGNTPKTPQEFLDRLRGLTSALLDNPAMFGFCYTQLTDIEQEQNGIFTYDRKPKFPLEIIRPIFSGPASYEKAVAAKVDATDRWRVLVGAAVDGPAAQMWRYSTERPEDGWERSDFSDAGWRSSPGAFGRKAGFERLIRTAWTGKDIWLRGTFEYRGEAFRRAVLALHYDNATSVHVNGVPIWTSAPGAWNDGYDAFDVTTKLEAALRRGTNVIAVHCRQDEGGQFIDLALLTESR
jgi:hypothetical protein